MELVKDSPLVADTIELSNDNLIVLNQELVDDFRKRKIIRDLGDHVELPHIATGEERVGDLTDPERAIYIEILALNEDLQDRSREVNARSLEMFADAVRKSEAPMDVTKNLDTSRIFPSKAEAEEYFAIMSRWEYLRMIFTYSIRERFGHNAVYGVRNGFVAVRTQYKFQLTDEFKNSPTPEPDLVV